MATSVGPDGRAKFFTQIGGSAAMAAPDKQLAMVPAPECSGSGSVKYRQAKEKHPNTGLILLLS
jgi:hypothetical protein